MFDEMDYRATFEAGGGGHSLPNLRLLRQSSFHATHAYQPSGATTTAIPSYTIGQLVLSERYQGADELMLRLAGSNLYVPWTRQSTLFHEAAEQGRSTAILGYFHPYCRLFGELTSFCETYPLVGAGDWQDTLQTEPLHHAFLMQAQRALPGPSSVVRFDGARFSTWHLWTLRHFERQQMECLSQLRKSLLQKLADTDLDFVYAHIPLPHPPDLKHMPGAEAGVITQSGYFGNLQAADRLAGEIREALVSRGRWDETTLILTSDHTLRTFWKGTLMLSPSMLEVLAEQKEPTVPFLVKLPHQNDGLTYREPFNAVLLHGIVRALLRGELHHPEEIAQYLDANKGRFPLVAPGGTAEGQ